MQTPTHTPFCTALTMDRTLLHTLSIPHTTRPTFQDVLGSYQIILVNRFYDILKNCRTRIMLLFSYGSTSRHKFIEFQEHTLQNLAAFTYPV